MNLGASRMICEHPCQVKHYYCSPFLQIILLPVGPGGSTPLANCMSLLCAMAVQDMSSPSRWFRACDSEPWPTLMQELYSLSPWKCHHLSGSFLALDIFCPSSVHPHSVKSWSNGWGRELWPQDDAGSKTSAALSEILHLIFYVRWLKTIEIKSYLHDAEASIPSSEGTERASMYIRPQWQSVSWIL